MPETAGASVETVAVAPRVSTGVDGLSWRALLFVFFASAFVLFLRRPDALTNPQFWSEDGAVWYAQAYRLGWVRALPLAEGGYFNLLPRLAGAIAVCVPLHLAPLVMNATGLFLQMLPVLFLLSTRCSNWGPVPLRSLLAVSYLVLPNSAEVHATITNTQWHVALLLLLILTSEPPKTGFQFAFDGAMAILGGLTGPYCFVLALVAAYLYYKERSMRHLNWLALWVCLALIQAVPVLTRAIQVRSMSNLGATPERLARLLGGQVVIATVIGPGAWAESAPLLLLLYASVCGLSLLLCCYRYANESWRAFLLFVVLVFACSLKSPYVIGSPAWRVLEAIPGNRYFYLPSLAFSWALIFCVYRIRKCTGRVISYGLLCLLAVGSIRDFRLTALPDLKFGTSARIFEMQPKGATVNIPLNPVRTGWELQLTKH